MVLYPVKIYTTLSTDISRIEKDLGKKKGTSMKKNCLIAQSGGPTAVINSSAVGVAFESFRSDWIDRVYASENGILGVLTGKYFCLNDVDFEQLKRLKTTPSSAFGSCRHRLKDWREDESEYVQIFRFFQEKNIGYFFYIGGNDSMDTVMKLSSYSKEKQLDVIILGIPKTIDNDLALTDHCPGYGSAAKYIGTSLLEIYQDAHVYQSELVTIVEVMGRNAGWLAASSALAQYNGKRVVDLIYLPEIPFSMEQFLKDVKACFDKTGNVLIVVSEGIRDENGVYLSDSEPLSDGFGHQQLGGVGQRLKQEVMNHITQRVKCVEFNILQRCAAHCLSETDVEEAYKVGKEAVHYAENGKNGCMVGIRRVSDKPYLMKPDLFEIDTIANQEKKIPQKWIVSEGNYVTQECLDYMQPLIMGEKFPDYENGLPAFSVLKCGE